MAVSTPSGTVSARISAFQSRPATSFGPNGSPAMTIAHKQRSLGNLAGQVDRANELLEARARLKHVTDSKKSPKKADIEKPDPHGPAAVRRRRTNSSVLEELDDLLDTAIGEHTNQVTITHEDATDDPMPDWPLPRTQSFTSKSPSRYASRHSKVAAKWRQPKQRHSQTRSSDTEFNTAHHAHGALIDSDEPRSSTDIDTDADNLLLSELEREPVRIEVPKKLLNSKSPIRQRAALFEKLSQHQAAVVHEIPHVHDSRNPIKIRGMWPPKPQRSSNDKARAEFGPALEKHHMKFHHGRDEVSLKNNADSPPSSSSPEKPRTTHVPPIALTLPQLVGPRRRSRPDIASSRNSFTTAPQTKCNSVSVPADPTSRKEESTRERKTSSNWPLKWHISRKSPDPSVKESGVVARAEPDHHTSTKKTHENQHRVHDLLVAAKSAVNDSTPEPQSDQQDYRQTTSIHDLMPGALADTPRGSSAAEKEAVSQSPVTPAGIVTPGTPRGRRHLQNLEVMTNSPNEEKDSPYKVERRFALSRSRSRGGGVSVRLEIRSPNMSPERGGEHTVIVTANVEPVEEDRAVNEAD